MNKKFWYSIPVVLIITVVALFLMHLNSEKHLEVNIMVGQTIPSFQARLLQSPQDVVTEKSFAGRFIVLKFFASWCKYCRIEAHLLQSFAQIPTVDVVGMNVRDDPEKLKEWLEASGNPFKEILLDPEGDLAKLFAVKGTPETFMINPLGQIIFHHRGPLTYEIIRDEMIPKISGK